MNVHQIVAFRVQYARFFWVGDAPSPDLSSVWRTTSSHTLPFWRLFVNELHQLIIPTFNTAFWTPQPIYLRTSYDDATDYCVNEHRHSCLNMRSSV